MADFGIAEAITFIEAAAAETATVASAAAAEGATAIGLGAEAGTIGSIVSGGVEGALAGGALGGLESGITGKNIGQGILGGLEGGAISGGAIGGFGPLVQGATGLSATASDALVGAGAGALGSKVTGSSPLAGAVGGAIQGGLTGASQTPSAGGGGSGIAAPASAPAPASVAQPAPDLLDAGSSVSSALPGSVGAGAAAGGAQVAGLGGPGASGVTPNLPPISTAVPSATALPSGGGSPTLAGTAASPAPSNPLTGALSFAEKNPAVALAGGGLALSALKGNQNPPFFDTLNRSASAAGKEGALLEGYLANGTLPPGQQGVLNAAGDAASATIRSQYASRGQSGSSAEAQDLAAVQERTAAQGAQLATQLFSQGVSEMQLSDSIYAQLMNEQIQQDQQMSSSIATFTQALALSGRPAVPAGG